MNLWIGNLGYVSTLLKYTSLKHKMAIFLSFWTFLQVFDRFQEFLERDLLLLLTKNIFGLNHRL